MTGSPDSGFRHPTNLFVWHDPNERIIMWLFTRAYFALMRRNLIYRKRFWLSTVRKTMLSFVTDGSGSPFVTHRFSSLLFLVLADFRNHPALPVGMGVGGHREHWRLGT